MGLLKKTLETVGFKIVKINSIGQNPFIDIKKIFGENKINTIFDIGANEGQTVKKLLSIFPKAKIYSFEPGKEAFNILNENYGSYNNIITVNCGLGKKNETLKLVKHRSSVTDSFLNDNEEAKTFITKDMSITGYQSTEIKRLDYFCGQNSISSIDLLKIDTQGFEINVLKGIGEMLNPISIKAVIVEVCFAKLYRGQATFCEIEKIMMENGYKLVDFYDRNKSGGYTIKWADLLFVSNKIL